MWKLRSKGMLRRLVCGMVALTWGFGCGQSGDVKNEGAGGSSAAAAGYGRDGGSGAGGAGGSGAGGSDAGGSDAGDPGLGNDGESGTGAEAGAANNQDGTAGEQSAGGAGGTEDLPQGGSGSTGVNGGTAGESQVAGSGGSASGDGNVGDPDVAAGGILQVDAGGNGACAIDLQGRVKCWGRNQSGQLGLGDREDRGDEPAEMGADLPYVDLAGAQVVQMAVGEEFACARLSEGSINCWGRVVNRRLGYDVPTAEVGDDVGDEPGEMGDVRPVGLDEGDVVIDVDAGDRFTCALLEDHRVKCWGHFYRSKGSPSEVQLDPNKTVLSVAVGSDHGCALYDDGAVACFGSSRVGQLGNGAVDTETYYVGGPVVDVDLGAGVSAKAIAAGGDATCVVLQDDALKCWGGNQYGELGLGDTNDRGDEPDEMGDALPTVDLGSGLGVVSLAMGYRAQCAILTNGTLKCWGYNAWGELGLGDSETRGDEPGEMGDALPAIDLGPGRSPARVLRSQTNTYALTTAGELVSWGFYTYGGLGTGRRNHMGDEPHEMGELLEAVDLGL